MLCPDVNSSQSALRSRTTPRAGSIQASHGLSGVTPLPPPPTHTHIHKHTLSSQPRDGKSGRPGLISPIKRSIVYRRCARQLQFHVAIVSECFLGWEFVPNIQTHLEDSVRVNSSRGLVVSTGFIAISTYFFFWSIVIHGKLYKIPRRCILNTIVLIFERVQIPLRIKSLSGPSRPQAVVVWHFSRTRLCLNQP